MSVELRPAAGSDADALAAIWHRGWRDAHVGHVPDELVALRGPDSFRQRAPGLVGDSSVAVAGGRVVGFVTVCDDEVDQLFVDAAARGTGTASALIALAERVIVRRHPLAWLSVVEGNGRARRFYERRGWRDAGPFEEHVPTVDGDALVVPSRRYEKALVTRAART